MKTSVTQVKRKLFISTLFAFCLTLFNSADKLQACMICIPYPETTLADRLLEYDEIIFAREQENVSYQFYQLEILRGSGTTSLIKLFCDSATRRKLKTIPQSAVVLARSSADDEWKMITFANSDYQSFIRTMIQQSSNWYDYLGDKKRVNYFSQHLTNDHPQIQEQAYLEVGRAPYGTLKALAKNIPRKQVYEFINNLRFLEWHSLYILFLGQSNRPEDHSYIRQQVESLVRLKMTTNLSAWLTAFIETNPETGVSEIETWYFSNPDRSTDELDEVITSLSVLGSQRSVSQQHLFSLRNKIVNSYGTLLDQYPEMAGRVAKDLAMWQVNAHVADLSEIQKANRVTEPAERYLLDYYLSMAVHYQRIAYEWLD